MTIRIKPTFLFNKNGTFRDFGAGFVKKTIIPAWLFSIFLAVFSYIIIKFVTISSYKEYDSPI